MSKPNITFYGLGAMGGGMASNLVKKGYHVTGFDVYAPLMDRLVQAGGHASPNPRAAATDSPVVIIMVATMHQASSLLFDGPDAAIKGIPASAVVILCSTCPPTYPSQLRGRLDAADRRDVRLLDCPVSGGTLRAAAGTLSIFASGDPAVVDAPEPRTVLRDMAADVYGAGSEPGAGQKVKCVHQLLAATNIVSASEAMGLAVTAGLDTGHVYDWVRTEGSGASFMFENRVPHMLDDDWTVLSALAIIWKDAGIVCDAAKEVRFPVPLANVAEQLYCVGEKKYGLLKEDDARLVVMYTPTTDPSLVHRLRSSSGGSGGGEGKAGVTAETVDDLLAGIHLAASVEAMAFAKALGVDRRMMYDIISKAAGWTRVFTDHVGAMLAADEWGLERCEAADGVRLRLETALDRCRTLAFPAAMGGAALQQYYFAGLGRR